ncbi:hypothetical protein GCM10011391_24740 [Pullulanibacillus camelliae]|uniref:Xylose isomerase-like TIM barrel domain-containing protein n=1 Tax=Pullulanibacillus camelliae TaxID=1707096 RepID=A0A8J2YIF7_9BACL|nr:TIM barrel protein [Pullulanibacillus camelliae]GGE44949.1 hypothetical protein GCM10011391_24740 [Pullulanibacillus camelliae]
MATQLGISGSTIMSDTKQLETLFTYGLSHIEIGEFADPQGFERFMQLQKGRGMTFGIHAPLYRTGSKNDLLQKISFDPELAWEQLEKEAKQLSILGAKYILVHFPFLATSLGEDAHVQLERSLQRLKGIQDRYGLPIVCEPKLGPDRSPLAIETLQQLPIEIWETYNLKLCIDVGDYALAVGERLMAVLKKWLKFVKVVHLHNIEFQGKQHFWVPIHPSHEQDPEHLKIVPLLTLLSQAPDVIFILEHTPHLSPGQTFVNEGIEWLKSLV